ncbi:MAG TPA: zf-TFIIB domain-containing protein, partial [Candidatus Nanopelagicales bacterium]|nr:zf-TFIIB domain-containing protein [Candidatus Nanopelagicales bacterium]
MTQPPSLSPFACPRCAISMYVGQAGGMTLHGCGRCGGVWLGRACAQRLAEALPNDAIELATRASSGAALTVDVSPGVRCPACAQPTQRTQVAAA